VNPSITFTDARSYNVTLQVSNGSETSTVVSETITAMAVPINNAPTAAFTVSSISVAEGENISFDASTSTDIENTSLNYTWDFGNGETSTLQKPITTYTTAGTYTVTLVVNDNDLNSTPASQIITVTPKSTTPINTAPTASFSYDNGRCGGPDVSFDASASSDADGDPLTYTWNFGDGTTATGVMVNHIYNGSLDTPTVTLTVSDGKTTTDQVTQIGSLLPTPCAKPVGSVNATANIINGVAPLTVSFNASVTGPFAPEEYIYEWIFNDGNATSNNRIATHTFNTPGIYNVSVSASAEGDSELDFITITVTEPITTPTTCNFGTPTTEALPTTQTYFTNVFVLGSNGPNLDNINGFAFNWDLPNNSIYSIALQTNNGVPAYYLDLRDKITYTLNQSEPNITFTGSGVPGFDGSYFVAKDGDNIALVSQNGGFTIYLSNEASAPTCGNSASAKAIAQSFNLEIYPNPFLQSANDKLTISSTTNLQNSKIELINLSGKVVLSKAISANTYELSMNISTIQSGLYIISITSDSRKDTYKLIIN